MGEASGSRTERALWLCRTSWRQVSSETIVSVASELVIEPQNVPLSWGQLKCRRLILRGLRGRAWRNLIVSGRAEPSKHISLCKARLSLAQCKPVCVCMLLLCPRWPLEQTDSWPNENPKSSFLGHHCHNCSVSWAQLTKGNWVRASVFFPNLLPTSMSQILGAEFSMPTAGYFVRSLGFGKVSSIYTRWVSKCFCKVSLPLKILQRGLLNS